MYLIILDDGLLQTKELKEWEVRACMEGELTIVKVNSDGKFVKLTPIDESDIDNYELVEVNNNVSDS